ncbi:uncharacterized protein MELLADRAFT_107642 [Melampsora larici-populina 98AG31]|uniref:Uncharacterized protein n=1 Tax=Melampsora larici-populina (strain 98AG31 / pathotype 3-4-7) TaxID=747676 RepID=F4RQA6_MELLP|nr:uncharacterized protein MELLADRAFT_107642 [Melampsora larici-populina 98AG31]EGG05371.1 hypothetical protein MELLADRAFT_107642 [Melampsora larici-populina 98AG31]
MVHDITRFNTSAIYHRVFTACKVPQSVSEVKAVADASITRLHEHYRAIVNGPYKRGCTAQREWNGHIDIQTYPLPQHRQGIQLFNPNPINGTGNRASIEKLGDLASGFLNCIRR